MAIGERVRALRKLNNWTQVELAERSGLAQGHITDLERGRTPNPTGETLARLAKAFNVSVDALTGSVEVRPVDLPTEGIPASFARLLRRLAGRLDDDQWEVAAAVLRTMARQGGAQDIDEPAEEVSQDDQPDAKPADESPAREVQEQKKASRKVRVRYGPLR